MPKDSEEVLHLVTQEGQPYGSTRLACEECGLHIHGNPGFQGIWTDDKQYYREAKITRCRDIRPS